MGKLIELLNEYEKENGRHFQVTEIGMGYRNNDLMVISKRYGFIKRLVDNNKTNEYMITEIMINSQRRYTGKDKTTAQRVDENYSDLLLMLLAISDNPIDLLCERLK